MGVLPIHANHDHAIKLASGSNPLYRSIYNLSEPEQAVLLSTRLHQNHTDKGMDSAF